MQARNTEIRMGQFMVAFLVKRKFARRLAVLICLIVSLSLIPGVVCAQSYWDALFQLGFDPEIQKVDRSLAYERIEMLLEFRERISEHLEVEKRMQSIIGEAQSRMNSLDMGNLYDLLPYSDANGMWRAIGVRGGWDSANYRFWVTDPLIQEWLESFPTVYPEVWGDQQYFGDQGWRTFVRPKEEDKFRVASEGRFYLADLPVTNIVRVIQDIIVVTASKASDGQNPPPDFLKGSSLEKPDLKVLNAFASDFPEFFRIITRYMKVEEIVSGAPAEEDGQVMLNIKFRIDREAFKEDYPALGKLFDRVKEILRLQARILDERSRVMMTAALDTKDLMLSVRMATQGRQIVAMSHNLIPEETAGFNLIETGRTRFRCVLDVCLNIMGLHLDMVALPLTLDYFSGGNTKRLEAQLNQPPESITASGYVMKVIPVWLVDLIIPSNIEDIARKFFRTLAASNGGKGAIFEYGNYPPKALNRNLWVRTDAEVLANGMVRFAFNLSRRVAEDSNSLNREVQAFRKSLREAFTRDYQRMRSLKKTL